MNINWNETHEWSEDYKYKEVPFSELEGKTVNKVIVDDDESTVTFVTDNGKEYIMGHVQD